MVVQLPRRPENPLPHGLFPAECCDAFNHFPHQIRDPATLFRGDRRLLGLCSCDRRLAIKSFVFLRAKWGDVALAGHFDLFWSIYLLPHRSGISDSTAKVHAPSDQSTHQDASKAHTVDP